MRSRYNIHVDTDTLNIMAPNIRRAHEDGHRIIWVREGAMGVVPDSLLEAEFKLYDDFMARRRQYDRVPEAVGLISWNQVVQVCGDGSRGHGPVTQGT